MNYSNKHLINTIQNIIQNKNNVNKNVLQNSNKIIKNKNLNITPDILHHLNEYTEYFNSIQNKNKQKVHTVESLPINEYVNFLNIKNKKNSEIEQINPKITEYDSYLKQTKKTTPIIEKPVVEIPKKIKFNGHEYFYNENLNNFINQFGHTISVDQALILEKQPEPEYQDVFDFDSVGNGDSPSIPKQEIQEIEEFVTLGSSDTTVDLGWIDPSNLELEFEIYYREII